MTASSSVGNRIGLGRQFVGGMCCGARRLLVFVYTSSCLRIFSRAVLHTYYQGNFILFYNSIRIYVHNPALDQYTYALFKRREKTIIEDDIVMFSLAFCFPLKYTPRDNILTTKWTETTTITTTTTTPADQYLSNLLQRYCIQWGSKEIWNTRAFSNFATTRVNISLAFVWKKKHY